MAISAEISHTNSVLYNHRNGFCKRFCLLSNAKLSIDQQQRQKNRANEQVRGGLGLTQSCVGARSIHKHDEFMANFVFPEFVRIFALASEATSNRIEAKFRYL